MDRHLLPVVLLTMLLSTANAQTIEGTRIPLPDPGGWVMLDDGVTLIVSNPPSGELIYIDTVAEQEVKRVTLDFKPADLALQKDTLYAAVQGASLVYALDPKTGKEKQEIVLGGAATSHLACHPQKGLVYASTMLNEVFAIDPATGTATKTEAIGNFLAVDPVNASALFTGVQPQLRGEELIIKELPNGKIRIYWDEWGLRAFILKYAIQGTKLKLASSQLNAAVNAYNLAITPDGKKVMMPSGGGWRPPVDNGAGGGYMSAAFSTQNLEARMGEAPSASNIAFHPVLNLGVVNRQGVEMVYFNPKSLIAQKTLSIAKSADSRGLLTTFGAKGTKVVLWNGDFNRNTSVGLNFFPLELTAEDRAALGKAYGKLPAAPKPVASKAPTIPDTPKTATTRPAPKPASTASAPKPTPSRVMPRSTTRPATRTTPTIKIPLEKGVIASTGFNDSKGINQSRAAKIPYPLGESNVPGGLHEPGWQAAWNANPKAAFVTDDVAEGDGALHLMGTTNYGRSWSAAQKSMFIVEASIRCPAESGFGCYIWKDQAGNSGPNWGIGEGHFRALNGDRRGSGKWVPIAPFKPDTWHKVKLTIDVKKQTWRMAVDDVQSEHEFGFRYNADSLQAINLLVQGQEQIYVDGIRILSESDD